MNLTDKFVDDLYRLSNSAFPEHVLHQAKRCLLDYLGVAFAGAVMLEEKAKRLLDFLGNTHGSSSVIGFSRKADVQTAAFINGLSAHVAELDDGVRFGMIHPGSPIISTLLPLAEKEKVKGVKLLAGIIVGYEAAVRIACAMQPSHYNRGFHPTATCGTIGAAMGVASILGFTVSEMKSALSAASVSASGTLKVLEDGSELKPFNAGRAAHTGLLSASMAKAGFKGPDEVFSGQTGFFSMMSENIDLSQLENNDPLGIEKTYSKPYASCRHTHPAIEAAIKIKADYGIRIKDIKAINVRTYHSVLGKHDNVEIFGVSSAKMSIPYSIAVALVFDKVGIDEFTTECLSNPEISTLMKKIVVSADDKITRLVPRKRAAIVEIITYSGCCHSERIEFPKGEPENPLSDEEIRKKFISLSMYGNKSSDDCQRMVQIVWNIEEDINCLYSLL